MTAYTVFKASCIYQFFPFLNSTEVTWCLHMNYCFPELLRRILQFKGNKKLLKSCNYIFMHLSLFNVFIWGSRALRTHPPLCCKIRTSASFPGPNEWINITQGVFTAFVFAVKGESTRPLCQCCITVIYDQINLKACKYF